MSRPDAEQWKAACAEELLSFAKAELYDEVERPRNRKVIDCKWVFRIKRGPDGGIQKYKARLITEGFTQVEGIDYTETFAPVTKFASIRTLLAIAVKEDLEIHQMDIKPVFLNGDLDEEIFMECPPGFRKDKQTIWKLWKSLYGDVHSGLCARKLTTKEQRKNDLKGYVRKVTSWFPDRVVGRVKSTLG